MIDRQFTIDTLQELVRINSVNPDLEDGGAGEKEISEYIHRKLKDIGIESELEELAPGRFNLTATLKGSGNGNSLMLNAHTDTVGVAGMDDPFSGNIVDGKLYGRGAYDMKASIAAILAVGKAIIDHKLNLNGDLVLSFVADEEYASIGAQALVRKLKTDAAIVTEPTDLNICLAHRGFAIYNITTTGKTAHGGQHRLGIDANTKMGLLLAGIDKLARKLPDERKHPLCGEASLHIPTIRGGRSLFIYSSECHAQLERRTLPGETEESVESELKQIIEKLRSDDAEFNATLETELWRAPYEVDHNAKIVSDLGEAVQSVLGHPAENIGHTWWEDSAFFGKAGIETVIIGPKGGGIHEDVEWVELDSVVDLATILLNSSQSYCK